ncbi:MAG: MFS transporter [Myxococcota bacterium]|nr:MFS transporter [Myxococcota bacterium]
MHFVAITEGTTADKVPIGQKLGYGLGSLLDMWGHWLYPTLAYQVFNIFLGVSPAVVARALFISRLFDAASDPIFGWLSDNTRTRFGRRRPYILLGSILAGIGLPMLFFIAPGWSEMGYFWFMVGSSAIFVPVMSCFNMPYQSLGAELTPDYHERTSVFAVRNAIQKIPEVAMFYAAQFTTLAVWTAYPNAGLLGRAKRLFTSTAAWSPAANEKPNILLGAQVYCAILGTFMIMAGIAMFALVRERYYDTLAVRQERIAFAETLWKTLKCRPFRLELIMVLAYAIGLSMVGTLGYYDTVYYVCKGNVALGAQWNFYMGIAGMLLGLVGIPVYASVAHRFGKVRAMMTVLLTAVVVFVSTWWIYNPNVPWLQPLASAFIAFTAAGFWMLDGSIGADVIDYDEIQTGKRREGAFSACKSWITKVGMALGALTSGEILARTGFDAKVGPAQTEHSLFMIRFFLAFIPVVGLSLAAIAMSRFPLTPSKMTEIRRELEARRGIV